MFTLMLADHRAAAAYSGQPLCTVGLNRSIVRAMLRLVDDPRPAAGPSHEHAGRLPESLAVPLSDHPAQPLYCILPHQRHNAPTEPRAGLTNSSF